MNDESPLPPLTERLEGPEAVKECVRALCAESDSLAGQAQDLLRTSDASRDAVVRSLLLSVEKAGWEQSLTTSGAAGLGNESNAAGNCLFLLSKLQGGAGTGGIQETELERLIRLAARHTEAHISSQEVKHGLRSVSILPSDGAIVVKPNPLRNSDIARWWRAIDRSTSGARREVEGFFESLSANVYAVLAQEIEATGKVDSKRQVVVLPGPRPLLEKVARGAIQIRKQCFERELSFIADAGTPLDAGLTVGLFLRILSAVQREALMRRLTLQTLTPDGEWPEGALLMDLDDAETLERVAQESAASATEVSSVVDALISNTATSGQHSDFRTEVRPGSKVFGRRVLGCFSALAVHPVRWVEDNLEDDDCGSVFEDRVAEALMHVGGQVTARNVKFALATGEESEVDLSFLWRDNLFLIECKARALGFGRTDRLKHAYEAIVEGARQLDLAGRWLKEEPVEAEKRLKLRRNTLRRVSVSRFIALASPSLDEVKVGDIRALHAARVLSAGLRKPGDLVALLSEPIDPIVPEDPYLRSFGGRSFIVFP